MDKLLSVEELAEKLCVPKSWVYSKTRTGELPFYKCGRYCRFDLQRVMAYLEQQSAE